MTAIDPMSSKDGGSPSRRSQSRPTSSGIAESGRDEVIVELEGVSKRYRLGSIDVEALRDVSLIIRRGEFSTVAGPSGSGKTTLLNLIGGVDTATSGRVTVAGNDTTRMSDRRLTRMRRFEVGFVFQSFNLVAVLDAFQNVELPLLLQRSLGRAERRERVEAVLAQVGLGELTRRRPRELSGGQRQRVAVARALVTRPPLVLADEPTANLDSATGAAIVDLMKRINEELGTTFIFSTHDQAIVDKADRVIRLADGRIAA
jgi:putative ABC transport system ATP-binding protein